MQGFAWKSGVFTSSGMQGFAWKSGKFAFSKTQGFAWSAVQWGVELLSRLLGLFAFFDLGKSGLTNLPMGRGDSGKWGESAGWLIQPTG